VEFHPVIISIAGLILGAIVGSFLATILVRWPRGESVSAGRSRCDGCGRTLRALELVPILSWAVRRGRCGTCGARIDARHVSVELAAAAIGLIAALAFPWPMALATALLGWWLLILAALDVEHHWLPDALTLPLIPTGLAVAWLALGPPLVDRIAGAALGGLALWLIAITYQALRGREGMGGGDPKLMAGIGAWIGLFNLPFVLLGASLLGLASVAAMAARGVAVNAVTRLPLGALLAVAAWAVWLAGEALPAVTLESWLGW
jgi:leader peptidase (prepilin peptidase)/N-methyltransferase